jgi:transposase-like protein
MAKLAFPRTLLEFQRKFGTEDACRAYLVACRWPEGFRCSGCGACEGYAMRTRPLVACRTCGRQTSVTAKTVLHRSRQPLRLWFWAAYLVTTQTPGISATQLQRQLGLRRYETAWAMLQKLRRAMRRPDRDRLRGIVEVDETYLGGVEPGRKGGRKRDGAKLLVIAAVEVRGDGSGRARLAIAKDSSQASLVGFVRDNVDEESVVRTDAWQGYAPLRHHYDHRPVTQGSGSNAPAILPRIHRLFSNLKTWIAGTHHGVGRGHVRHYLDEFVFRFNRRRTPMAAFQSLLGLATLHGPTTYEMLYGHESTG